MGFLNTYVVIVGSLILIAIAGFFIWWLLKKIEDDKCTTSSPSDFNPYYVARGSQCDQDTNYLWWDDRYWGPWYFPAPGDTISKKAMTAPARSPKTDPNCLKYNAGDMERMCTADKLCIGWSKEGDASKCYFYKDPTHFKTAGKDAIPHYSCVSTPNYPAIGGIKNEYLNHHSHPVKAPS